jgi:hypothetical protein
MIAMIATMAALVAPAAVEINDRTRVEDAAKTFAEVALAVDSFSQYVRAPGRRAPGGLSHLTTPLTGTQRSSCNNTYNTASQNSWLANGPFGTHMPPDSVRGGGAGGIWTPIGLMNERVSKSMGTAGQLRTGGSDSLFLQMSNLDWPLATLLDEYVDGAIGQKTGIVQYTDSAANGTTLLSYYVPGVRTINAC